MRDALLGDLSELSYEIITTIDERLHNDACQSQGLSPQNIAAEAGYPRLRANTTGHFFLQSLHQIDSPCIHRVCKPITKDENAWDIWAELIKSCDAVLVIAPETDGILLKFAQLTQGLGKVWLGCNLDAIDICGDKLKTHQFLHANHASIPTFTLDTFLTYAQKYPNVLFAHNARYIAKPRFGAGCEDTFTFDTTEDLSQFMQQNRAKSHIIQTFIEGRHASLVMLCKQGKAWLLCANQQLITNKNNRLHFSGVVLNGFKQYTAIFAIIVAHLAEWLPGLNGLVGVDIVFDEKTASIIEINPRLTTSYVGLGQSIGQNPAKLLLDCWQNNNFNLPILKQKKVTIRV